MSENKGDLISQERQDSLKTVLSRMKELRCQAAMEPNDPYMTMIKTMLDTLIQHFEKFPAVDAVEVVRCKDCRYSRGMNDAEKKLYLDEVLICTSGDMGTGVECPVFQNDYCSYGERKDGADNG